MDANPPRSGSFDREVRELVAAVEACLPAAPRDREGALQRAVFEERREVAVRLATRLKQASAMERTLLDGDLYRARAALALSRDYFVGRSAAEA